ncbi:hypothetical protein GpartN1_g7390.t1 [Galdieria partita]|uniref:enoyl-[acyl-carrier-protein] reductase n=1 Tax=Galdieria partita TaxID=83374 RepID=A0A9C7Q3F9_9RHOD|nr:hypothetical protein GpartN1_g7390.t1 [Galdieria partita]
MKFANPQLLGALNKSTCFIRNISGIAYTFSRHGRVTDVLKKETQNYDEKKLGPSQVLVSFLASSIGATDLAFIRGMGKLDGSVKLPSVAGLEGVAEVLATGNQVKSVAVGDRIIPFGFGIGAWREHGVFNESQVVPISKKVKLEHASLASGGPCVAYRLLEDFVHLSPGDVVIQNCGTGAVGLSVAQIGKAKGLRVISVIRERGNYGPTVERLKAWGNDIVVSHRYVGTFAMRRLLEDLPPPKLALNGAGGPTATELARLLGKGGTMVTYGNASRKPFSIPTGIFTTNDISLRGFSMLNWLQSKSENDVKKMLQNASQMMESDQLKFWIERKKLEELEMALESLTKPQFDRRIVLVTKKGEMYLSG